MKIPQVHTPVAICWLRRDLRLEDNKALFQALKSGLPVIPLFIFDSNILSRLDDKADKRLVFIHDTLSQMQIQLKTAGSSLLVMEGKPEAVFTELLKNLTVKAVFFNHDYEPEAMVRDKQVAEFLMRESVACNTFKDQVIFERSDVRKPDGTPYTVFTPYMKKWKSTLNLEALQSVPSEKLVDACWKTKAWPIPSLESMGFKSLVADFPKPQAIESTIRLYATQRDFPAIAGTSRLSVHLRFGTVSIRQLVKKAAEWNETWLNELIWREFYMMILFHFPHVTSGAFKPAYNHIPWNNNEQEFERWCKGQTGYPIVDAGMRELNETGFMHNRLRMITACFLTKNMLTDWRWGEAYFASKLLDYDLSANNGGWQWAASTGCDAAPYFRIFSPMEQTRKFDPKLVYINKWIPELNTLDYPQPVVEYKFSRDRAIATYKKALERKGI
jgi:deoxyribodipyrimidine photo-lyase